MLFMSCACHSFAHVRIQRGVIGGPDPPGKLQVIWISIELAFGPPSTGKRCPPLENVGPPLDRWKSIVFFCDKTIGPPLLTVK